VRENGKPFAFVLSQVQARSGRLKGAAGSLGDRVVALKMADVLALPAIVLRNDQQDALGVGLGVTEYAPRGKSAEEIRGLWRWVWARLSGDALARHLLLIFSICDSPFLIRMRWSRQRFKVNVAFPASITTRLAISARSSSGVAFALMPSMLSACSRCFTALSRAWR
jgi:hypothetical protein